MLVMNNWTILFTKLRGNNQAIALRLLMGKLRSKGIRIQWERLRCSLLRTDPTGVHLRWRKAIRRRKYWVPGPLALWHIDGNHKLIRFVYRSE